MLRSAVARSSRSLEQGARLQLRRQWLQQRSWQPLARTYADARSPDKIVLPGSQSGTAAGVPQTPILQPATPTKDDIPPSAIPPEPPAPADVRSTPPPPSINTGNLPPTGTGSAKTGPSSAPPPPPPRKRHRFRNFVLTIFLLSTFGYAGGVYYSLVNDNFHDFFTEYVPYGEDAVAYFEDREFRKRFPGRDLGSRHWPQTRGENKITVGRQSGVTPRVAESEGGSDLGQRGRHSSAMAENTSTPAPTKPETPSVSSDKLSKTDMSSGTTAKKNEKTTQSTLEPKSSAPAVSLVDNLNVAEGQERAVQELVKLVNNIITAINVSPEAPKYASTVQAAKRDLDKVIGEIKAMKDQTAQDADNKIKSAHTEFDNAAKELVRRLEAEMREQETRWREEYEQEREKLSTSYQQKLSAELDAAKKVLEQKNQNALLEQEVKLQKKFMDDVKAKIEEERSGRLAKLDELSGSVQELEKLTGEWNAVVDATLQTQHLQVALEAVRAKLQESDHPTPFINELVALKEVSKNNDVVNAAIASINPVAYQRGVPSAAHLIDRFRRVATEVRKASLLPEDAGVASHAASAVLSRFMFQKKSDRGLPEGEDVEATLARTEVLLEEGDLDAAAREMNSLKGWAGVLSKDWVQECRRVLEVRQAVDVIAAEARLQSLLVD